MSTLLDSDLVSVSPHFLTSKLKIQSPDTYSESVRFIK